MADTIDGVDDGSDDFTSATADEPKNIGTIDSVDGRPSLPFSVAALAVSFVVLYFTPILELALGFGGPSIELDSGMKLLVSFFLAFGIGIFWEYIF